MSGKPKDGIPYAGWRTDIFDNDTKIDKLLDAYGWIGFSVYFYLCLRASGGDGYFYRWGFDLCSSTARRMGGGISSGTVQETVGYCLQIGLFDKGLFDGWGILTSKGIQRSYWAALQKRRVKRAWKEFWLLEKEECEGLLLVPLNSDMSETKADLQVTNEEMQTANATIGKDRKGKEKKTMCKADASALFEQLWSLYPSKKGKGQVSDSAKMRLLKVGKDEMMRAIDRYKTELDKDKDWRKPQNGSTFFNKGYIDYLDANYVPGERRQQVKGATNRFNQFEQRDYDFDELEKKLLSN